CYCALAFNGMPPASTPVMMGWMNNWQYAEKVPTHPWRGQMTVPRRLALKSLPDGVRLVQEPTDALEHLRGHPFEWAGEAAAELNRFLKKAAPSGSFEIQTSIAPGSAKDFSWKLLAADGSFTLAGYDAIRRELFVDRTRTGNISFSKDFPARTAAPLDH